ncbi:MAG: hypothetical protein EXR98_00705 [Gemmataceae bacterium]|nr:hypothetical protein [Gemmataceae bacterium]
MSESFKYVIDAAVAAALFVALSLVFAVDLFLSRASGPGENTLKGVTVSEEKGKKGDRLRLAVTPTARFTNTKSKQDEPWDDMGKLLKGLGDGYKFHEITEKQILAKQKKLSDYDVLFLTCAGGGEQLKDELREFVANGGVLYASDWRYDAVAMAFPEMVEDKLRDSGAKQDFNAQVVDPALRDVIGDSIHLKFDMPEWKTAAFGGPRVKTLIKGRYEIDRKKGEFAVAPLMVKFTFNKGTVIFTSFHNEKQNSLDLERLLQYLVFTLVMAGVDADINAKMDQGGFTPQRSNLLSSPKKNQATKPKEYQNAKECTLRFALGFRGDDAKLRFNIKSPDGKQYTHDAAGTVVLEVAYAAAGTWTYTVTSLELPHENFAFTVTVGEKK